MELQWDKKQLPCLREKVRQVQNQEQTLEVRLGDEMPDIGRVICGWGQGVLRSKQWHGDGMSISGGIMAWVLYAPEDGSAPRSVEAWLPFNMKWNFPSGDRDGAIRVDVKVRNVDARVLSARKLMVRAALSVLGEGLEPDAAEVYTPGEDGQNVQLLVRTFPVTIPAEAGEKTFLMDEDLEIPGTKPVKIICCNVSPCLAEQKVLGGKAVFRGDCRVHLVYFGEDDLIHSTDLDVPFAQYSDLDRDYDKEADVSTIMAVSSLEPEWLDGVLRLKCGLIAQYVVLDNRLLELAQDAYSTTNQMQADFRTLELPAVLDRRNETHQISQSAPGTCTQIVDVCSWWEQPVLRRSGLSMDGELTGTVQVLCRDEVGQYQCVSVRCNHQWSLGAGEDSVVSVTALVNEVADVTADGTNLHVSVPVDMETLTTTRQQLSMISGMQIGEAIEPDPGRPSMILRRTGSDTLWDLAKYYGSTVEAIQKANDLEGEPAEAQMLLIPVS